MKNIIKLLSICLVYGVCSCSDLTFGDKFLGSQPESSGAVLDSMFSSKINADKVLTSAYTYLPYGLPTGAAPNNKTGSKPARGNQRFISEFQKQRIRRSYQPLLQRPVECQQLISKCRSLPLWFGKPVQRNPLCMDI